MAETGGISGIAVAVAASGGILMYAGFQGMNPLQALKEITSGQSKALSGSQASFVHDASAHTVTGGSAGGLGAGGGVVAASYKAGSSSVGNALAQAALNHQNEKYSQARRWQSGYSDCSSFVGKAFKDVGIAPPGGSVTGSYLTWSKLTTVSKSHIQAGDILCSAGHVAIALSPTTAIGQQNARRNVQVGPISSIMANTGNWYPRRYTGSSKPKAVAV